MSGQTYTGKLATHLDHNVLERRSVGDRTLVLCHLLGQHNAPYVTWVVDSQGACHWGHYFSNVLAAGKDFAERAI
jgi:hypothetical protein